MNRTMLEVNNTYSENLMKYDGVIEDLKISQMHWQSSTGVQVQYCNVENQNCFRMLKYLYS